ncbi:flagellar biosynthesis protein FlhF [Halobacillus dabanensis]|uniref:Flagellar biosynthesis protein FlhF n=2 Tax=Halobacillus dabanensis TaxID=240302 RepID=A0A1I3Y7J0_HALDA|nr:flagellar biosynthesis protein FlhF [Halobacillus dabanensis]
MPEAMKKVRSELGPDAVILNSKVTKTGGFLGMFKRDQTEVIAAIDPADTKEPVKETKTTKKSIETSYHAPHENKEVMNELRKMRAILEHKDPAFTPLYQQAYDYLVNQEITEELARLVVENVQGRHSDLVDVEEVERLVTLELYEQMKECPFGKPSFDKKYIHLVGPTGVGKTTTLAKLGADAALNHQLRVGFITTDTYRIAAIDQLKTYAKILDVPLEVAYSLEDYKKAKNRFKDYDLVLVDTAGRNFREASYVKELQKTIDFDEESDNFLVLGLTSKLTDMKDIFQQFKEIPIHQMIFTKVDETSKSGNALNMVMEKRTGIAYLTDGQNVPDDIKETTAMGLARKVMEGFRDERSS